MRPITTILTQLLCMVIWFRFTHQFLNPKENNWKREIKVYVLWTIWTIFTATIFWHDTEFKALITPFFLYLSFSYIYQPDRKRFIITIILIFLVILISEIISILIFITVFHRQLEAMNWMDNLLLLPLILAINYFILHAVLKRKNLVSDIPNISLIFVFLQIPIMLMIDLSYQQHAPGSLKIAVWILAFFTLFFQIFLWKKRENYYNTRKQEQLNVRLKAFYTQEMSAYMKQRDQEQLQRRLRHDLLNEIQVIKYMENKETDDLKGA